LSIFFRQGFTNFMFRGMWLGVFFFRGMVSDVYFNKIYK